MVSRRNWTASEEDPKRLGMPIIASLNLILKFKWVVIKPARK
jgi:hypothetical protein